MKEQAKGKWQPSEAIGIALSGGGSRATAFHLGTLEYLHRVGLLINVKMLSSASGGSFVAAKYALFLAERMRAHEHDLDPERNRQKYKEFFDGFFNAFFKETYEDMRDIRAVKEVLELIGQKKKRDNYYKIPSGRYTLINAAADLYARTFLRSTLTGQPWTFGQLLQAPKGYPLKSVILNATDYHNGVAFRFANNSELGNVFFYDGHETDFADVDYLRKQKQIVLNEAHQIRIADIVAASSCIPPLFTPIGFPDDFAWPNGNVPETIGKMCSQPTNDKERVARPVPLMDGGPYDNQAIESLILADRGINLKELYYLLTAQKWNHTDEAIRERKEARTSQLGMFIVSDADSMGQNDNKYEYNEKRKKHEMGSYNKGLSIGSLVLFMVAALVVCEIAIILALKQMLVGFAFSLWQLIILSIHFVIFVVLTSGCIWLGKLGYMAWKKVRGVPQVGAKVLRTIFRLRIPRLHQGLYFRLFSSKETIFDILLKRIRDLGYWVFYGDSFYNNKRISNLIYCLRPSERTDVLNGAEEAWREIYEDFKPSADLYQYVEAANQVETRFWFLDDVKWEQPSLVACGQATICFNLIRFIVLHYGSKQKNFPEEINRLWNQLVADWRKINNDPYILLQERATLLNMTEADGHTPIVFTRPGAS